MIRIPSAKLLEVFSSTKLTSHSCILNACFDTQSEIFNSLMYLVFYLSIFVYRKPSCAGKNC